MKLKTLYPLSPKLKVNNDFYVFDTETGIQFYQTKSKLGYVIKWKLEATQKNFIFGVIKGHNFTKVIHSLKEMQDEFKEPRYKNKKVFAHNFGKYDGSVLFDNIFSLDNEAIYIGSRFISCSNGNCTFADSLNIYKASVKEIGHKMGLEKLGMSNNYKFSQWPNDKARDINGCIRDCEIIYDALLEIFEECGDIKITIGSLCMTYFRRFAMDFYIQANDNVKHFWNSYYGGRTEAFKLGKTHSQVIDVNSLYPDRMKNIVYPNPKFLRYEHLTNVKYFEQEILREYEGCAYISVYHPDMFIGLLPYRHNGKLCFPCGNFSGCYNFNEIRFALSHGVQITKIEWVCYSEKMLSPFEKFVDKLSLGKFLANSEGRALDEWKYKYLMNNLYGKFGQHIDEKTIYLHDIIEQYDLVEQHIRQKTFIKIIPFNAERCDCFLVVKPEKNIEISYAMPSFSSYITSAGRIKLATELIAMEHNKPTYCDTDSIFYEIDTGIKSSNILGEWKVENKIVTEIRNLKDYSYIYQDEFGKRIEKSRTKGVPGKAIKNEEGIYEFISLMGTKEGLRRNLEIGTPHKRTKEIKGNYEKRIVFENGETKPITI